MKSLYAAAAVALALVGPALAQTSPPPSSTPSPSATPAPSTPAVPSATTPAVGTQSNDPGAPLPGANSFTQAQAQARIEQLGYANVTSLVKDADGIWRGSAMKDGRMQKVAVDFRGNIVVGQN